MTKKQISKELKDYPTALTVEDVAQILRVSTKTVYKIIRNKEIPAVKVGREYRIAKSAVVDHLRNLDKQHSNPKCVISDNTSSLGWISERSCDIVQMPANTKGAMKNGKIQNESDCQCAG